MKSIALISAATAVSINNQKIVESIETFPGWGPHMEGFPGTINQYGEWFDPYNRKIPERFQGDAADEDYYPVDKYTQSMLYNHSMEAVAQPGGLRTHDFGLTKAGAKNAAFEILGTHFGMSKSEA